MRRLRLDLAYDGTDFHGWAAQPGLRTVQGELESALAVLLGQTQGPRLTVAGRTDAGVHARGQVAHVDIENELVPRVTARRLGAVLARTSASDVPEILVYGVSEAPDGFDARFSAMSRRYTYRLWPLGAKRDVLAARFTAQVSRVLEIERLQQASDELVGLRDFAAFCKARVGATSVRDLTRFEWQQLADGTLVASLAADAFCHSMVRALVGAAVGVASERISMADLVRIRDARERTSSFTVMPAHGLTLEEVGYPPDDELALRAEQTRARRDPLTNKSAS